MCVKFLLKTSWLKNVLLLKINVSIKNKNISNGKNERNTYLKIPPINRNKKSKNIRKSTKFSNI